MNKEAEKRLPGFSDFVWAVTGVTHILAGVWPDMTPGVGSTGEDPGDNSYVATWGPEHEVRLALNPQSGVVSMWVSDDSDTLPHEKQCALIGYATYHRIPLSKEPV